MMARRSFDREWDAVLVARNIISLLFTSSSFFFFWFFLDLDLDLDLVLDLDLDLDLYFFFWGEGGGRNRRWEKKYGQNMKIRQATHKKKGTKKMFSTGGTSKPEYDTIFFQFDRPVLEYGTIFFQFDRGVGVENGVAPHVGLWSQCATTKSHE